MKINGLTEAVEDAKYALLHKILVENKSKVKAICEVVEKLDLPAPVLIKALRKVDECIIKKYGDEMYYMVCLSQTQWVANRVLPLKLIDEGFRIQKDLSGEAAYSVCVDGRITAKLFKSEDDAIKFLYGSSLVTPLPVKLAETQPY